jgi:uncharacterized protein (UPF0548 family)
VFTFAKPSAAAIQQRIAAARNLPAFTPSVLSLTEGLTQPNRIPAGFVHDFSQSSLGIGEPAFTAARRAFESWRMFSLGWVRVANPEARITPGQLVAVEVHALSLWSLNVSRIEQVVDTPTRFGFLYATTRLHVEEGEERFLLEFDPQTGQITYELEAISRPRALFARLGHPVSRAFQHKFARDSHRKMKELSPFETSVPSPT